MGAGRKALRTWLALLVSVALIAGFVPASAYAATGSGSSGGAAAAEKVTDKDMVIVLDAGHGGKDPGASAGKLKESALTLKLAKYCKAELEKYQGVKVVLTRSTDKFLKLENRVKVVKKNNAIVYVSLHINSSPGASGFEVWIQNNSSYRSYLHKQSKKLGKNILGQLSKLGLKNRGTMQENHKSKRYSDGSKADRLVNLRESRKGNIPAVLVEHGYINGATKDRKLLSSNKGLRAMAAADAAGIAKTYGLSKSKLWAGAVRTSNGKMRWRTSGGSYKKNAWKTYNGSKYYFGADGFALRGHKTVEGKSHYFNAKYQMKTGWHKWKDGTYSCFSTKDGHQLFGKHKVNGKTYNFGKKGTVKKK